MLVLFPIFILSVRNPLVNGKGSITVQSKIKTTEETYECGDKAVLKINGNEINIEGTGEMSDCDSSPPWSYQSSDFNLIISSGITKLGRNCFKDMNILSVTMPETVSQIGDSCFSRCGKLQSISIPKSVSQIGESCFSECSKLNNIVISNDQCAIGSYCFSQCISLEQFTVPNELQKLNNGCFSRCSSLQSINIPTKLAFLHDCCFQLCSNLRSIVIPESVIQIGSSCFSGCEKLQTIEIKNSACSLGEYCFEGCAMEKFNIPNELKDLYEGCFKGCYLLKEASIPNIERIPPNCFENCSVLESVQFSDTLTEIGNYCFLMCRSLKSIDIPSSVEKLGSFCFQKCSSLNIVNIINSNGNVEIGNSCFRECTALSSITLPDCVISIGSYCFSGCTSLSTIKLPEKVNSISYCCFESCTGFEQFSIPDNVQTLKSFCFLSCVKLSSIEIGKGLSSIEDSAFALCLNLNSISFSSTNDYLVLDDNVLYTKDRTNLIVASRNIVNVNLPESLNKIAGYAFCECRNITNVNVPDSITYIGSYAFFKCINLELESLPNSLTEVGEYAFCRCYKLTKANLQKAQKIGQYAFAFCREINEVILSDTLDLNYYFTIYNPFDGCYNIESFTISENHPSYSTYNNILYDKNYENIFYIPYSKTETVTFHDNLKTIELYAFQYNKYLTSLTFGPNIESIKGYAFQYCINLETVSFSSSLSISYNAFQYCTSLKSITSIKQLHQIDFYAFDGCISLESVGSLLDGLEIIGERAFQGCVKLEKVNVPVLNKYCFLNCTGLTEVSFSEGIEQIYEETFKNCIGLKSIKFPQTLKSINQYAFENCENLESIDFNNAGIEKISENGYSFPGCVKISSIKNFDNIQNKFFDDNNKILYMKIGIDDSYIISLVLLEQSITDLNLNLQDIKLQNTNPKSFYKQTNIKSVILPANLHDVSAFSFQGCTSLETISFPENLQFINEFAFSQCTSLKTIIFNSNLQSIGNFAFSQCTSLIELFFPKKTIISQYSFECCTNLVKITLNDNFLGQSSFSDCIKLNTVIWSNEIDIEINNEPNPFPGCKSLKEITNLDTNTKYSASKEGLYTSNYESFLFGFDIEEFTFLHSPKEIKCYAFCNCTLLNTIKIPKSVEIIDKYAFYSCQNLQNIIIENNVKYSDPHYLLFNNCPKLHSIEYSDQKGYYNSYNGCVYLNDYSQILFIPPGNQALSLHENLKEIQKEASRYNTAIEDLNLQKNNIQTIGDSAFESSKISSIELNENLEIIEPYSFYDCSNLKGTIIIPTSINGIFINAFKGTGISQVIFDGIYEPSCDNAFENSIEVLVTYQYQSPSFCGLDYKYKEEQEPPQSPEISESEESSDISESEGSSDISESEGSSDISESEGSSEISESEESSDISESEESSDISESEESSDISESEESSDISEFSKSPDLSLQSDITSTNDEQLPIEPSKNDLQSTDNDGDPNKYIEGDKKDDKNIVLIAVCSAVIGVLLIVIIVLVVKIAALHNNNMDHSDLSEQEEIEANSVSNESLTQSIELPDNISIENDPYKE